jgi:hypothetical protein
VAAPGHPRLRQQQFAVLDGESKNNRNDGLNHWKHYGFGHHFFQFAAAETHEEWTYSLVNFYNYGKSPCSKGKSTISMAIFMMSFRAFSVRNISSHLFFQHDLGDQALCEAMFGLFGGAVFLISPGSL